MSSPIATRIVLFVSGGGSNARAICSHFANSESGEVVALVTNNPESGAFEIGKRADLPVMLISRSQERDGLWLMDLMRFFRADLIALAGYIRLIPTSLVQAFPRRIVNIHPSLLPAHGGKGMFGLHVHDSVLEAGDTESGITIHFVNEHYDEGEVIRQEKLNVDPAWSARELQQEVLRLEHHWYPRVLEALCEELMQQR